jgi:hypothetical protein
VTEGETEKKRQKGRERGKIEGEKPDVRDIGLEIKSARYV